MKEYLVILIGVLDPYEKAPEYTPSWGTAFATYNTLEDCRAELGDTLHLYKESWPDAQFDCYIPSGRLQPSFCKDDLQCHLRSKLVRFTYSKE